MIFVNQLVFNLATGELVSIDQFEEQDQATSALPDCDKLLNAFGSITQLQNSTPSAQPHP